MIKIASLYNKELAIKTHSVLYFEQILLYLRILCTREVIVAEENAVSRGYLQEEFRLFHNRDTLGAVTELHYHDFYKIMMLIEGRGSYTIQGRRYELRPGDVVLVGRGFAHKTEFLPGYVYERLIFFISQELLDRSSTPKTDLTVLFSGREGHVLRPSPSAASGLFALARSCERELHSEEFGSDLAAREDLMQILLTIGRTLYREALPPAPKDNKILQILRYVDEHLTEDISVDELSERFFISKYHMMRRFKAEAGSSIHQYQTDKRLLLARELLRAGSSATDACFSSGFHNYSTFARAYGKHFGISPTEKNAPSVKLEGSVE